MRRWVFIAALGVVLLAIPVWAQRGGYGGMSGGGRGGGFGYHGGGGYDRGPMYGGAPHGGGYWGGGGYGGWHGYPGRYPGHFPYYPGRYPYYPGRYGWRWGYPWRYGFGGYSYPGWGWYGGIGIGWNDTYNSYPAQSYPSYVYTPPDNSSVYTAANQQQEIDRLNDEIGRLRYEQPSQKPAPQPPKVVEISSATVLVFGDHHTEEVQNYAIVGKTLWVFTEQRARKIPIAELDVVATTKANDARGIDFRP